MTTRMTNYSVPTPPKLLTPSELVFLHAEQFSQRGWFNAPKLSHLDIKVAGPKLVQSIVTVGFLANELSNNIFLGFHSRSDILRFITQRTLYAFRKDQENSWPLRSLEYQICALTENLEDQIGGAPVKHILYQWIGVTGKNPYRSVISKLEYSLGRWQKYDRIGHKVPLSGPGAGKLSAEALDYTADQPIEPVVRLLGDYTDQQPKKVQGIISATIWAFSSRTDTD